MFGPIGASIFESIFTIITITEDQNKILLVQSIDNSWSFPRGRLQKNETIMEASTRIVLEYTGITTKPKGIMKINHESKAMFRKSFSRIDIILQAELTKQPIQELDKKIVKSINWINIDDVDKLKLMEEDVVILEHYKDSKSNNQIASIDILDTKVL